MIYCQNDPCEIEATHVVQVVSWTGLVKQLPLCNTCHGAFALGQKAPDVLACLIEDYDEDLQYCESCGVDLEEGRAGLCDECMEEEDADE